MYPPYTLPFAKMYINNSENLTPGVNPFPHVSSAETETHNPFCQKWRNPLIYWAFLDRRHTVSTCHECTIKMHIPWLFVKPWFENDATVPCRTCKIKHDAPLCTCHSKRLDLFLRYRSV